VDAHGGHPAPSLSLPPSSSQPQTRPASGRVSLAPAAAQYPGAASIQPVITEYFQGITSRNYAEYLPALKIAWHLGLISAVSVFAGRDRASVSE
jgi:hypothetical protein